MTCLAKPYDALTHFFQNRGAGMGSISSVDENEELDGDHSSHDNTTTDRRRSSGGRRDSTVIRMTQFTCNLPTTNTPQPETTLNCNDFGNTQRREGHTNFTLEKESTSRKKVVMISA
jgi:hypothetical protein